MGQPSRGKAAGITVEKRRDDSLGDEIRKRLQRELEELHLLFRLRRVPPRTVRCPTWDCSVGMGATAWLVHVLPAAPKA